MKLAVLISSIGFFITRYFLLFEYRVGHYSDFRFYYRSARKMLTEDLKTYCDFSFPYPPLSIPLVSFPSYFKDSFKGYIDLYRQEMFFFDIICFVFILLFLMQRLNLKPTILMFSMIVYSCLGLLQGHLIYERLDLPIATAIIAMLYFYTGSKNQRTVAYVIALIGSLIKLIPLFVLPVLIISEFFRESESKEEGIKNVLKPILIVYVAFVVFMVAFDIFSCGGLFNSLAGHGKRGIHLESVWASPLLFLKNCCYSDQLGISFNYGAFHIKGDMVLPFYLFLSKYLGFALLLLFYVMLSSAMVKRNFVWREVDPEFIALMSYTVLFIILSTQRVFSPQFLIWVLPGSAILIAMSRRPVIITLVLFAIYGLTYMEFDNGMWKIVHFHPEYVNYLILRNVTIVLWTLYLLRRSFLYVKNYYTINLKPL